MPEGLPELTLGYGVIRHATRWLKQPNGPLAGKPWTPTLGQALYMLWWYALTPEGRWIYSHGARRLAKGSGKSPFAAVMAIEELVGPVRLDHFDPRAMGGAVGKPQPMALVQIAATAASQTANTMRMVRAMTVKGSPVTREHGLDVGKTIIYGPNGAQLETITSSDTAQEGAEMTFGVEDETEHWLPAQGGPKLAEVLERNAQKSGSRTMETSNAWQPGDDSVAEVTYNAWVLEQEGRTRGNSRTLYDARIAPPGIDLTSHDELSSALQFVYADCPWVDVDNLINVVWDPRNKPDSSKRFYLNIPTSADNAWTTAESWDALSVQHTQSGRQLEPGEPIVLFFDPSGSRDATALVACAMSDGFVAQIGHWESVNHSHSGDWEVPYGEVQATVESTFQLYDVVAFFADVHPAEGLVKITWPELYGKDLIIQATGGKDPQKIAWDMRSHLYEFTLACELTETEIREQRFEHDGSSALRRHVVNARNSRNRYGISVRKETKDSEKKIDACVAMIGARMVRRLVLASKEWEDRSKPKRRASVVVLG